MNSEYSGNFGGSYARRPSESESLWKKMIGKPYSGKPNVRFDEGELEIEPFGYYASSLLYRKQSTIRKPIILVGKMVTD